MSPASTSYMKTEELVRLGRVYSAGAVPDEFRQSLPVPRRTEGGLTVEFFFCPALARPQQPVQLAPPKFIIRIRADNGQLVHLLPTKPSDFDQSDPEDEPIGTFGVPEGMTVDEFMDRLNALYAAQDVLMPAFDEETTNATEPLREAARAYERLFGEIGESVLLPYYDGVGKEWSQWVAQMAR